MTKAEEILQSVKDLVYQCEKYELEEDHDVARVVGVAAILADRAITELDDENRIMVFQSDAFDRLNQLCGNFILNCSMIEGEEDEWFKLLKRMRKGDGSWRSNS